VHPAVTDSGSERDDTALLRQEAIGAFSHEIRTPLTSIRMVLELAARQSGENELVLDGELSHMLTTSVDDLQRLVDELQETSRLERGRAIVTNGPASLRESVETAAASIGHGISLVHDEIPSIEGPWDPVLLPKAIAGFAETANRAGEGMGDVTVTVKPTLDAVQLVFRSGTPSESSKAILADVGFAYFRSRQFVLSLRGTVSFERGHRFAAITMALPRN
jgi:signal transduction histidine kinase